MSSPIVQTILDPVDVLPGIGPKKKQMLSDLGIHVVKDLLSIMPKSYQHQYRQKVADLAPALHAVVVATVLRARFVGRGRFRRLEVVVKDDTGHVKLVFFSPSEMNVNQRFAPNAIVTVVGTTASYANALQMVHPRVFSGDKSQSLEGLWPIYPELKGIFPSELGKFIRAAFHHVQNEIQNEWVPKEVQTRARIYTSIEAYSKIHFPRTADDKELHALNDKSHPAFRRIAFEELFSLQLRMQRRRHKMTQNASHVMTKKDASVLFDQLLPFKPTQAQSRVIEEILTDFTRHYPMVRLLQGDVGAGKTAVAATACLAAVEAGLQCALMAPTEILARQHFQSLHKIFAAKGIKVICLTGNVGEKDRRQILTDLKDHNASICVGTHALISQDVAFAKLGLCIIDEQHRFGVAQRALLKEKGTKGNRVPHVLAMTATPIPRTLALTLYGDFAISVLDELPPGRTPVRTRMLHGESTATVLMLAQKLMSKNEQGYVIYPLVEESEKLDLLDATRAFKELEKHLGASVALIHGRLPQHEKDSIMQRFAGGEIRLLVSTTVVEVGVDVPNATCMMIVHAERFGLSQLHQLRGRVGRGAKESSCYLMTEKLKPNDDAYRRLTLMEKTNDGFAIAAEDLAIRGHGDFLGTKQSGQPLFNFCDLSKHADLVEPARELAIQIAEEELGAA